ncbi:hypothetical protein [Lysinibacillus sp. FSL P2-0066]|uniref:hypothetical protein n=1 Tax=Lysinibacillus sp. FSL P2-0066 TaxID=2921720 RepID=UPI0030DAFFC8
MPISNTALQTYEENLRQTIQCFFNLEGQVESVIVHIDSNIKKYIQKKERRFLLASKKKEKHLEELRILQSDLQKSLIGIAHVKQLLVNEINTLQKNNRELQQTFKEMLPLLPFAVSSIPFETSFSSNVQFNILLSLLIEKEIVTKLPLLTATIESSQVNEIIVTLDKFDVNIKEQINEANNSVAKLMSIIMDTENELDKLFGDVVSNLNQSDKLSESPYTQQDVITEIKSKGEQLKIWADHYQMLHTMFEKDMEFQEALHLTAKVLSESLEEPAQIYQNQRVLQGAYLLETGANYMTLAQDVKLSEQQAKLLVAAYLLLNQESIAVVAEQVNLEFMEIEAFYKENKELFSLIIS